MSDAVLVAIITGGISLLGSVLTIISTSRKQQAEIDRKIAVIETKLEVMKGTSKATTIMHRCSPRTYLRSNSICKTSTDDWTELKGDQHEFTLK